MSAKDLDQVVDLALQLSDAEQELLLARVTAHLTHKDGASSAADVFNWTAEELAELLEPGSPKTGAEIAAMLESGEIDTGASREMMNPHITDAVTWVKALRRDAETRRNLNWDK